MIDIAVCYSHYFSIFEYDIVNCDTFELQHKKTLSFETDFQNSGCKYSNFRNAMCLASKESLMSSQQEKYEIMVFGGTSVEYYKWVSLTIDNQIDKNKNNKNSTFIVEIDDNKTEQFKSIQNENVNVPHFEQFGYAKWKHHLILFGGKIDKPIDLIFYFDFIEMKWHQSLKVQ